MVPDNEELKHFLIQKFGEFLSEKRKSFVEEVLQMRTNYIQVVLEDIIDPHNVSAVLRTGECLGIQQYHIIDQQNPFKIGRGVSKGATKWIDIHHYREGENRTQRALSGLRQEGYRVLVTSPKAEAKSLEDIDLSKPLAVILGNEKAGVSQKAMQMADEIVKIPMYGFTESYNVSVSAAIILHHLVERMRKEVTGWQFTPEQFLEYKLLWLKKCMAKPDYYQDYFVKAFHSNKRDA
ncbi:TrmH family RNA methyltransferase [Marivirga lumbricoides]|uniref:tRNA (guanosine(18)-2'-O)-methyltransferase n=1 Tax=Marivirga lumbricoides TaxID=1046115 RepID=A0A2T4DSB3_9BACT|nr:TrmH family RNA methyltransferase [Marivirga lumbricoides]